MSSALTIKGVYKNNKENSVGLFIKTNGLNNSKLLFDNIDKKELLDKVNNKNGKYSINEGLKDNKFKSKTVVIIGYVEGKKVANYKLRVKNIDEKTINNIINEMNVYIKKEAMTRGIYV